MPGAFKEDGANYPSLLRVLTIMEIRSVRELKLFYSQSDVTLLLSLE